MTVEKSMKYAKASLEMEGKVINEKQEALVKASLKGEIDHKEFVKRALLLNG